MRFVDFDIHLQEHHLIFLREEAYNKISPDFLPTLEAGNPNANAHRELLPPTLHQKLLLIFLQQLGALSIHHSPSTLEDYRAEARIIIPILSKENGSSLCFTVLRFRGEICSNKRVNKIRNFKIEFFGDSCSFLQCNFPYTNSCYVVWCFKGSKAKHQNFDNSTTQGSKLKLRSMSNIDRNSAAQPLVLITRIIMSKSVKKENPVLACLVIHGRGY